MVVFVEYCTSGSLGSNLQYAPAAAIAADAER
jgi:hypothetical protein